MADTTSDAFLSGMGIPVPVSKVEDELARLWGPAAEREGGPDLDQPTVTRIVLANLVVADVGPFAPAVDGLLDEVVTRYPCRAFLLRRVAAGDRGIAAEVSAVCHLPAPRMPQVCAERIGLTATGNALDLLPGAVRPLLETDLPMILWWLGEPRESMVLYDDLAEESSRILVDLPDPATSLGTLKEALDLKRNIFTRDTAWFGVTPWRELVAQFFDPPTPEETVRRISTVLVRAVSPSAEAPSRVSVWLVAWLAGQLGWTGAKVSRGGNGSLTATFRSKDIDVSVSIETEIDPSITLPHVTAVKLRTTENECFDLERVDRSGHSVRSCSPAETGHERLPRLLQAPEWDGVRRVAAALESARVDPPYRVALPHLLWMLG